MIGPRYRRLLDESRVHLDALPASDRETVAREMEAAAVTLTEAAEFCRAGQDDAMAEALAKLLPLCVAIAAAAANAVEVITEATERDAVEN
jgi:hypothetical protein